MFLPIFLFEIQYRLRRPATWIYFGLFFLLGFLLMLGAAGAFGNGAIVIGGNTPNVRANAPGPLNFYIAILSWVGALVASALLGNGVYRDFEYRTHSLFFTTPITKWGYLGGRFLGSLAVAVAVFAALAVGLWLGTYWPKVEAGKIGPNHLLYYVWPYVLIVIPNLIFIGGLVFTLATLTRNILSTYLAAVGLLIGYLIAQSLLSSLDNELIASAFDPFGITPVYYTTRNWTPVDQNTQLLPLSRYMLLNRALWMGIGLALLTLCYVRFKFGAFATDKAVKGKKTVGQAVEALTQGFSVATARLRLPAVTQHLGGGFAARAVWSLARLEWKAIVRNVYFVAIVAAGVLFLLSNASQIGKIYDTTTYPVTGMIVRSLTGQFGIFLLIIIIFYSGEAVWRDRDANLNQITDALPVPGWVPLVAKFLALGAMQVLLLGVILVVGVLIQTFTGYTRYEFDVYLTALVGILLPRLLLWVVLALTIQSVVNNKYVGHMLMIVYYLFNSFRSNMGLDHNLFGYAYIPQPLYSALNGWGHFLPAVGAWALHWSTVAVLMFVLAYLFWLRGTDTSVEERWKQVKRRFKGSTVAATALATVATLATGTFIFYNTNVLNHYRTDDQDEALQVEYEQQYSRFKYAPQPRITEVNVKTDLYPHERGARFRGFYWLVNRSGQTIDSLHVEVQEDATVHALLAGKGSKNILNDRAHNYRIERLEAPLAPGDSLKLNFDIEYRYRGFPNSGNNTNLVYNGTFINSQLLPHIGYSGNYEIGSIDDRKRLKLKAKPDVAPLSDKHELNRQFIDDQSDWVRFETVVGTEADQTAIAPGYLQKEWTEGKRRYFHYKMDRPIANFFAFVSARYTTRKDSWTNPAGGPPVAITVYYQPGHEYNLGSMVKGVKASLDYYSKNFASYPDRQVRILEFPAYQTFAQSFINTIPFSEGIGFIAKVDSTDPEDVDYPYYVTAHEMSHQWWGHQMMPANVEGSAVLSETMSQYAAMMVMRAHVGPYQMQKFLKSELNNYLFGRSGEERYERPIYRVGNQQHIYYQKGSVVMYGLAELMGEDSLNAAVGGYLRAHRFARPPYPTTPGWVAAIRKHAPDSLQAIIGDGLERITLYENKVTEATATPLPGGKWQVRLVVDAKKFYADSIGNQRDVPLRQDWIPIALFPEQKRGEAPPKPLVLQYRRMRTGKNVLEFTTTQKPAKAGVDPYHVFVDRTLEDNVKDVSEEKKG
jgi:ABC-2 type transport system permease protein